MVPREPLAANKPTRACVMQAARDAERRKREQELAKQRAKEWAEQEPQRQAQREAARIAQQQERDQQRDQQRLERQRRLECEKAERADADSKTLNAAEVDLVKALASVTTEALKPSHVSMLIALVQPGSAAAPKALKILTNLSKTRHQELLNAGVIQVLMPMLDGDIKESITALACFEGCVARPADDPNMIKILPDACEQAHRLCAAERMIKLLKGLMQANELDCDSIDRVVWAVFLLCWGCTASCSAVRRADGITQLANLLGRQEAVSYCELSNTLRALQQIGAAGGAFQDAILNALPAMDVLSKIDVEIECLNSMLDSLVPAALRKIDAAGGDELLALQIVDLRGEACSLPDKTRQDVKDKLAAFKRRYEFGLHELQIPKEFMCPITLDKMKGHRPRHLSPMIS